MTRETRHLWVGNLPENILVERIRKLFNRFGYIQSVKMSRSGSDASDHGVCAVISFTDVNSASIAHNFEHYLGKRLLITEYYEPEVIPHLDSRIGGSSISHGTKHHRSEYHLTANRKSDERKKTKSTPSRSRSRSPISCSSNQSSCHTKNRIAHAISIRNLPPRSSNSSLKDALFHEYKKFGTVTCVKITGCSANRYAVVYFNKAEDVVEALQSHQDKLFLGSKIKVSPYQGYDVEDDYSLPTKVEMDEFHPKATRTLFIGNLEREVTAAEVREHFQGFGQIIELDKKLGEGISYAFCEYADIVSVSKAIKQMDGKYIGKNVIKLGFGKFMPTNCMWISGIAGRVSEKYLTKISNEFGLVTKVSIDRKRHIALVFYDKEQFAQIAVRKMHGVILYGYKLQVDFASKQCQEDFYENLEKQSIKDHVTFPVMEVRDESTGPAVKNDTLNTKVVSNSKPGSPVSETTCPTQRMASPPRGLDWTNYIKTTTTKKITA